MMNYEGFLELVRYRKSIRRFKPNPIPDEHIIKILDAAHYAMSGANSQPWEFIVVKDTAVRERLFNAYMVDMQRVWYLEQQRIPEYRHPAFNVPEEERGKAIGMLAG